MSPNPMNFIGVGAMDVTKPYKFIGFGAMDVTEPYKFIGFGARGWAPEEAGNCMASWLVLVRRSLSPAAASVSYSHLLDTDPPPN